MKKDLLFKVVKEQLDKSDPCGLLATHCPADEYDGEAAQIVGRLRKGMSIEQISVIIAEVMNEQFEENFKSEEFMKTATEIKKVSDR